VSPAYAEGLIAASRCLTSGPNYPLGASSPSEAAHPGLSGIEPAEIAIERDERFMFSGRVASLRGQSTYPHLQPCNTSFGSGNLFGNIVQIRAIVEHTVYPHGD
jgi:hypothetical protein